MLIKNKKIKLLKNFILLLLVINFSAASFFVNNIKKEDCCHSPKQEVKPMACCEMMEMQTAQEECGTSSFSFANILSDCGCFHDFTPTQQTIQIVKTQDLTKVKVVAEISNEWIYENSTQKFANISLIENTESPPIYLAVSSFLI